MATGTEAYDNSIGGSLASPAQFGRPITCISRRMKAADIIAADGGVGLASASKITAGEEITAVTVPEGFFIFGVATTIITAGTTSGTINIGTLANTTAFDGAVAIDAAAGTRTNSATDAGAIASGGTLCTSATKVVVEYIADETTGEFVVTVYGLDLSTIYDA